MSCKEVSSYLLSLIGHQDMGQPLSGQHKASTLLNPFHVPPIPSSDVTLCNTVHDDTACKENIHFISYPHQSFEWREANTQSQSVKSDEVKKRPLMLVEVGDWEVRNRKGEVINLAQLAEKGDLFGEEIKRRTKGLRTKDQVLGYMNGLEGKWDSTRKKRKIVDADIFGDELPSGWKVLLGLRRKEEIVYLNCQKYVSPNGKQFMSCKEISSYILSLTGDLDAQPISCQYVETASRPDMLTSGCRVADFTHQYATSNDLSNCLSVTPSYKSAECEKQCLIDGVEKSGVTKLVNMLECRKCKMTFGDEDVQIHHMMTFHERSAKRCRVGTSLGKVIIKDGNFECQFCHEAFSEIHRYNGHIGAHARYQSLHGGTPLYAVDKGTSDGSSSLAVVPFIPSETCIGANKHEETITRSVDAVHVDSLDHRPIMENNETDHGAMVDVPEITESVSTARVVDNPLKDCDVICDKFEEFTEAIGVTGVRSASCRDATLPPVTDVTDAAQACSPVIGHEASIRKYVLENDYDFTHDKSAVIQESIVQCVGPNVCLDAITPSDGNMDIATYEALTETVLPSSTSKTISDHIMSEHKSEDSVNTGKAESIGTVTDKKHLVGDQGNNHDIDHYTSNLDTLVPSAASVDIAICKTLTETSLSSSTSKIIDNSINDHIVNDHKIEDDVNTSCDKSSGTVNEKGYFEYDQNKNHDMVDYNSSVNTCAMSVEGNECYNTLSISLVNVALCSSGFINSSSCTAISSSQDCNVDHKVEVDNCMIALSGSRSTYGVADFTDGIFTSSLEEHIKNDTKTNGKSDNGSCSKLTNKDTDTLSIMHNDLDTSYFIPSFSREQACGIEATPDCMFPGDLNKCILGEFDNVGNELRNYFRSSNAVCEDTGAGDIMNDDDGILALQLNVANKSSSWAQSSNSLPILDMMIPNQGEVVLGSGLDPKCAQENISGFGDLRLGSMETTDFFLMTSQESGLVTRPPPMEMVPSGQLEWGLSLSNMVSTVAPPCVCVWCNREFINEDFESEPQSGSLGYMCPECKSRVSGQLDLLGGFP